MSLVEIRLKRSTSSEWAAYNPVLGNGEPGLDTTLQVLKIGDGVHDWASLPVFATGETGGGGAGAVDWGAISNKPTTFPPSPHTHLSTDVTDLTEAVQDILGATIVGGSGATVTYNDAANTLTIGLTGGTGATDPEVVRDTIGAALVGVGLIGVTVDDAADTISITTTATQNATDAQLRDRSTHTGTQSADTLTDGTNNKAYTTAEKTKLAGVATGATQNATDAQLRDRSTHTGTQLASTISDFNTAADARVANYTKKVVTWATGSEPSLSGVPDGTLWVEYTP
jgi:hypothetical protein